MLLLCGARAVALMQTIDQITNNSPPHTPNRQQAGAEDLHSSLRPDRHNVVVGHSYGTGFTVWLASQRPAEVRGRANWVEYIGWNYAEGGGGQCAGHY